MQVFVDRFLCPKCDLELGLLEVQAADGFSLLNQSLQEQLDCIEHAVIGEILLQLLRKNVKNERVIQLIKRYLKSGSMENGSIGRSRGRKFGIYASWAYPLKQPTRQESVGEAIGGQATR